MLSFRILQKIAILSRKFSSLVLGSLNLPRRRFSAPSHAVLTPLNFSLLCVGWNLSSRRPDLMQVKNSVHFGKLSWSTSSLFGLALYKTSLDYASPKVNVLSFFLAKEAFSSGSSSSSCTPKYIIQRPDVSKRKIGDKVDAMAS